MAYKIGDKFVIEIDSVMTNKNGTLYGIKGFKSLVFDDYGLEQLERIPGKFEYRVGDEVCFNDGESFKGVVLDESVVNGSWRVLTENGCVSVFDEKKLHRTGRHFDEVETMLKKMRGEDDG